MASHEIVTLSSDEDERCDMPIIVSTMSVAKTSGDLSQDSCVLLSEGSDNITHEKPFNGKAETEKFNEDEPSTSAGPASKKRRVDLKPAANSTSTKTENADEKSPLKGKSPTSGRSIRLQENAELFKQLLEKCREIVSTSDMEKATQKAEKYFDAAQTEFIGSQEFRQTVERNLSNVDQSNIWGLLGDFVKQIKMYKEGESGLTGSQKEKDMKKEQLAATDKETFYIVLKSEDNERAVGKLNKHLKKVHRKIRKLEEMEVDFDEEDNSTFIQLERYKERATKIYQKLCEFTNFPLHADRMSARKITFTGTNLPAVNSCIERFVNANKCFPDYHDVLKLIETVNTAENLNLFPDDIRSMASKAFREIGRELKRRRQYDFEDSLFIHLDRGREDEKPSEDDPVLKQKLEENGRIFVKQFNETIDQYTQKQTELKDVDGKEEQQEVGSSVETENEEDDDDDDEEEDGEDGEGGHSEPEDDFDVDKVVAAGGSGSESERDGSEVEGGGEGEGEGVASEKSEREEVSEEEHGENGGSGSKLNGETKKEGESKEIEKETEGDVKATG